jgi:hypothetical protein
MNLEEFRKGLESDARQENEVLKKRINQLEAEQSAEIQRLHCDMRAVTNRCYALTRGTMCMFCRLQSKFECESSLRKGGKSQ